MKYTKNSLLTEASQIKAFIEKNKKIPQSCTLTDGKTVSPYSAAYLLSKAIHDSFKQDDYSLINVRVYDPTKKYQDTINNEEVLKNDYMVMISNFLKFCEKYHRVPRYVTTQKSQVKVSFELYMYCVSKIVKYYKENKVLPNYCNFNKTYTSNTAKANQSSKNSNKQSTSTCTNPYNSSKGCDAMGQNTAYYCGVSALQKCLYKLGIKNVTQKTLAGVCATTTAGTSHQGLRTGVAWASKKYNVKLTVTEAYFSDYTLKQLKEIICNPNKAIICHNLYRNQYGHYESWKSINTDNKTIDVINSLGVKCTKGCYCGYIETRNYSTQKQYCNGISQKSLIIITRG